MKDTIGSADEQGRIIREGDGVAAHRGTVGEMGFDRAANRPAHSPRLIGERHRLSMRVIHKPSEPNTQGGDDSSGDHVAQPVGITTVIAPGTPVA